MPEQPPRVRHLQQYCEMAYERKLLYKAWNSNRYFQGKLQMFLFRLLIIIVIYYSDVIVDLK